MVDECKNNKVAVTGMAWTTALGNDLETVWHRLNEGESGLRFLESSYTLRNNLAANVISLPASLKPNEYLSAMTRDTIERALDDASIDNKSVKIILIVGTSFGARLDDDTITQSPLNEWIDKIAEDLHLIPIALSTACSSASDAILIGTELIKSGYADICVCGGADILGDSKRLAHTTLGTMSPTCIRSFDKQRDGTILGEGAGFVVLEKSSKNNNKNVYALCRGAGSANDAAGLTAPDFQGNGIKLAIHRSLHDAQLNASQIAIINGHGSGTVTNDKIEATAYKDIFSHAQPVIFATKGAFGHTLGATGALEVIALILALRDQVIPPVTNLVDPLEDESLHFTTTKTFSKNATYGLSLTIGFGGFNTSLIFERNLNE